MTFLSVDIRRKTYAGGGAAPGVTAIADLRFEAPAGQFVCLVGPSGCGKSTLLHLVSGLDAEVDGSLRIGGRAPLQAPAPGYMFQSPRLMPWLSVIENVRLVASEEARRSGRPERLIEEMQLAPFRDAFANRLSGGMQRRVALARAFVNQPDLLLLDEPFVSLDAPVAGRLRRLLLELWRTTRSTVLFVTHDLREALYLGDRVLLMTPGPGRIAADLPIELPRPRDPDGAEIEALRGRLLAAHPGLLAELAARPDRSDEAEPA